MACFFMDSWGGTKDWVFNGDGVKALIGKNTGVFFRGELGIMISAGQINTGLSLKKPPHVWLLHAKTVFYCYGM